MALLTTLLLLPLTITLALPTIPFPPSPDLTQGIVSANISILAGGGLPNTTDTQQSVAYSAAGITALQLLAMLENIEAYFYSQAIQNLTSGVYDVPNGSNLSDVVEVVNKIAAQEGIHVATVGAVLRLNSAPVVPPCTYTFPVTSFSTFLSVAHLLTSTNFGSVIGVQQQLSGSDLAIAASTTSILGVETRHDAFLRLLSGSVPNQSPFDTGLPIAWAYNIGLQLVVSGSCPVEVPLPNYPELAIVGQEAWAIAPSVYPETMTFSWDPAQFWVAREKGKTIYAAWVNLFNQPVYTQVVLIGDGQGKASVPAGMEAVAFVALTTLQPSTYQDLQDATLVGPLAIAMT